MNEDSEALLENEQFGDKEMWVVLLSNEENGDEQIVDG